MSFSLRGFFYVFVLLGWLNIGLMTAFAEGERYSRVEIIAVPKSGKGPMWVDLKSTIMNIKEPVKVEWLFGDGQESTEVNPPPHYYEFGKYDVILEVTDKTGKRYTASVSIDAASPG